MNDADHTHGGETNMNQPYDSPKQGNRKSFEKYVEAIEKHGSGSSQHKAAQTAAMKDGWNLGGLTEALFDRTGPSGESWPSPNRGRRSAGETRRATGRGGSGRRDGGGNRQVDSDGGNGGLRGPGSPPVDRRAGIGRVV